MDKENKINSRQDIPIKNLFFMLCYAWNVLSIKDTINLGEDNFDNIYNLLARLLVFGVRKVIRQGFNRSYTEYTTDINSVRGKINIGDTLKHRYANTLRCNCTFDEFSSDNVFNQIVKYTMVVITKNSMVNDRLRTEIRQLLPYFNGIKETAPSSAVVSRLQFNRNNQYYKMLISICSMIYRGTMVNEESGKTVFKDFFREEQMQRVYELFILNFYAINLDQGNYKVHAPKISWHLDTVDEAWIDAFEIETSPGDRRTDIVIENRTLNYQFIIDAKYYQNMLISKYYNSTEQSYRTSHLNQVRGYVLDSDYPGRKFGALLYPTVYNNEFDSGKMIPIHDSYILMKTLNLSSSWTEIEADLLNMVSRFDNVLSAPPT